MNAKISLFVICVEAIIYLLLYNLHDCTFYHKIRAKATIKIVKLFLALILNQFQMMF